MLRAPKDTGRRGPRCAWRRGFQPIGALALVSRVRNKHHNYTAPEPAAGVAAPRSIPIQHRRGSYAANSGTAYLWRLLRTQDTSRTSEKSSRLLAPVFSARSRSRNAAVPGVLQVLATTSSAKTPREGREGFSGVLREPRQGPRLGPRIGAARTGAKMRPPGLEPGTFGLEGRRSIHLSYRRPAAGRKNRGERIRTFGFLLPKQARYQAALYPAKEGRIIRCSCIEVNTKISDIPVYLTLYWAKMSTLGL